MKETRTFENKERTARTRLESLRQRSKPLEKNTEQTLEHSITRNSKETREFENKEQKAGRRLDNLTQRSKPLEKH